MIYDRVCSRVQERRPRDRDTLSHLGHQKFLRFSTPPLSRLSSCPTVADHNEYKSRSQTKKVAFLLLHHDHYLIIKSYGVWHLVHFYIFLSTNELLTLVPHDISLFINTPPSSIVVDGEVIAQQSTHLYIST